ncbi:MAG: glycosyltransferase family 4 protein [bacterium]
MKICYFGTYDDHYPRNRILISGLTQAGFEVAQCHAGLWKDTAAKMAAASSKWGSLSLIWRLVKIYPKLIWDLLHTEKVDYLFVGYTGQFDMFWAKIAAKLKGVPVVFDAFLSLYDSLVFDRRVVKEGSLKARFLYWADKISCQLADLVLLDTEAHIDYFVKTFKVPRSKFRRILIGADDTIFYPREQIKKDNSFLVIHYGKYIPLHGLPYVVKAAKELESDPAIRFRFIGAGDEYERVFSLAKELKVTNIDFIRFLPPEELVDHIAEADVCLGIFGDTDKAARVIPNKVYECMAMAKPVITADSPASREFLTDGENCLFCRLADSSSIAEAILRLKKDPSLRRRIAEAGYRLFHDYAAPAPLGREVGNILKNRRERKLNSKMRKGG